MIERAMPRPEEFGPEEKKKAAFDIAYEDACHGLSNWGINNLTDREILSLRNYLRKVLVDYDRDTADFNQARAAKDFKKATVIDSNRARCPGYEAAEEWMAEYLDLDPNAMRELEPIVSVEINNVSEGGDIIIKRFEPDHQSQRQALDYISGFGDKKPKLEIRRACVYDDEKIIQHVKNVHQRVQAESETSGIEES
jgi:hypothetical protein